jgi:hypothetical protein
MYCSGVLCDGHECSGKHTELHFRCFRNGLRPSRFYMLKDNVMVMASEVGVYDTDPGNVLLKVCQNSVLF